MKKVLTLSFLVFSVFSFCQNTEKTEIYSLIINGFPEKELKINNKVYFVGYEVSDDEEYRMYMKKFLFLKKNTCKNFIKNSKITSIIDNNFDTDKKIIAVDTKDKEILRFSDIGFDNNKSQALVQYSKNETFWVLFDKKNGKWSLKEKINNQDFLKFISNL